MSANILLLFATSICEEKTNIKRCVSNLAHGSDFENFCGLP